jgi:hypothetical protein
MPSFLARLRRFLRARRESRALELEARRELLGAFSRPESLRDTSLRAEHRGRVVLVRYEAEAGRVARVFFTIVRHPRPYAFSRQVHEVLELWRLDIPSGALQRLEGANLSRMRGTDGEPSSFGPGI